MRRSTTLLLPLFVITLTAAIAPPASGEDSDTSSISIVVLKEHGVGSPTLAQPYLDKFVAIAAEQNDWKAAKGQYYTNRAAARAFIDSQKPHYAILSLPAFLALKTPYHFEVIGQVAVKLVGGRRYYLISKSATDLAGCKGKPLASDHTDDPRFIEKVVAAGAFRLTDFTVVQTQRPLQTIKKVVAGEAVCALVDDAQLAELSRIAGADDIHEVWKSAELPPMAVVAFRNATPEERKRFRENLPKLCDDDAETACAEVGIVDLKPASDSDYKAVLTAYGQ